MIEFRSKSRTPSTLLRFSINAFFLAGAWRGYVTLHLSKYLRNPNDGRLARSLNSLLRSITYVGAGRDSGRDALARSNVHTTTP
eukprot:1436282-Prymnesium_polylepis.1